MKGLLGITLLMGVFWISGGCNLLPKHKKPRASEKTALPAPTHSFRGSITFVNEDARFVLIDGGYSAAPPDGTTFKSYAGEIESGVLRVSAERRRPFIIADIVSGAPHPGHTVVEIKPDNRAKAHPVADSLPVQ